MKFRSLITGIVLGLGFTSNAFSQATPFDLIHHPYKDTVDQALLDSQTIKVGKIRVNQSGYRPQDKKFFYYVGSETAFTVHRLDDTQVGTGTLVDRAKTVSSSISAKGCYDAYVMTDCNPKYSLSGVPVSGALKEGQLPPDLPEGEKLYLKIGSEKSADFIIHPNVYGMVSSAILKDFGTRRSGNSDSWFHPPSHLKDLIQGGWYDCGDHLKEGITQSYAMAVLATIAATMPDKDNDVYNKNHDDIANIDGIGDILYEARFGVDYVLNSFDQANGIVANMITSIGNFGNDHKWWNKPQTMDNLPEDIGGPIREERNEVGANILGRMTVAAAIVAKHYEIIDPAYSKRALDAAKAMYEFGSVNQETSETAAYSGEGGSDDDLAWAAVALLYATKDPRYLNDLIFDKSIGSNGNDAFKKGVFAGGWFEVKNPVFYHGLTNTAWANVHTYALYSFYKLILKDDATAALYGISSTDRLKYAEDALYALLINIYQVSTTGATITTPQSDAGWLNKPGISYDPVWFEMFIQQNWIPTRYQAANISDLYMYYDIAKDLAGLKLPDSQVGLDWKENEVKDLVIRQLDFMLGVNPYDVSYVMGIGDKNFNHPHYRASNPEGRNNLGLSYQYRIPVGTMYGPMPSFETDYQDYYVDYKRTETCLDAAASLILPVTGLSQSVDRATAPNSIIYVEWVGYDQAIITIRQDRYGNATINYGTNKSTLSASVKSSKPGVEHQILLKDLDPAQTYYFEVETQNQFSGAKTLDDKEGEKYDFTTEAVPPASADIQNISICNISSDSAEILWFTPNGDYNSKVYWDESPIAMSSMANSFDNKSMGEIPSKFHFVKIGGLKEKTTYYYGVESDGQQKQTDIEGSYLKFTTPVENVKFNIRSHSYNNGMDFISLLIENMDIKPYDSLHIRAYFRSADPNFNTKVLARTDQCFSASEAGYPVPCEGGVNLLSQAVRMDDTRGADGSYQYYFPIELGPTLVRAGSRVRLDFALAPGLVQPDGRLVLGAVSQADHILSNKDWSIGPKSVGLGNPVDFGGMKPGIKNDMDSKPTTFEVNPYITVYRKGEFISGFSPSYAEQSTKRANYEMTVNLEAPFNVVDGTVIQIDKASPVIAIKGSAKITEGGYITSIWMNDKKVPDLNSVLTWNTITKAWDFNVPYRMTLGDEQLNLVIFAGPDPDCEECKKSGGCAFELRQFKVQFSAAGVTQSKLTLISSTNKAVAGKQLPDQTDFTIRLQDADKEGVGEVDVLVINVNRKDTSIVKLKEGSTLGVFTSSTFNAVRKSPDKTNAAEISFFSGDTIRVVYFDADAWADEPSKIKLDPDMNLDVSIVSFYAEAQFVIENARFLDPNCTGSATELNIKLGASIPKGGQVDSLSVVLSDGKTFSVNYNEMTVGDNNILVNIKPGQLPKGTNTKGDLSIYYLFPGEESSVAQGYAEDGVAPQFLEVAIVENFGVAPRTDTLRLGFSEPVVFSKNDLILDILNNDKSLASHTIKVSGAKQRDEKGQVWEIYIDNNDLIPVTKPSNFKALIKSGAIVSDQGGNNINECGQDTLDIRFVPQPVPIDLASIIDGNEDGQADSILIKFVRKLRVIDVPDSLEVEWGYIESKTFFYAKDAWNFINGDSSKVRIPLINENIMPHGFTAGTGGNGTGFITSRVGSELTGSRSTGILQDQVGPVVASAIFNPIGYTDQLNIVYSEPLDTINNSGDLLLTKKRGRTSTENVFANYIKQNWLGQSGDPLFRAQFIYDSTATGYVSILDSARLPFENNPPKDLSGNSPGKNNKFVVIKGQSRTPSYKIEVNYVNRLTSLSKNEVEELNDLYSNENSYKDYFVLSVADVAQGKWFVGSGKSKININPASQTNTDKSFGPTLKVTLNDIPTLGGLDELGFSRDGADSQGNPYADVEVNLSFSIYDNLGQFVNQVNTGNIKIENPNWVNSANQLIFYLEWMLDPKKGGPRSANGRIIGTSSYIGQVEVNMNYSDEKSPDIEGVTKVRKGKKSYEGKSYFGFKRF